MAKTGFKIPYAYFKLFDSGHVACFYLPWPDKKMLPKAVI
jgi:hypothetical protein